MKYSEEEFARLKEMRDRLVSACKFCGGSGVDRRNEEDCRCMVAFDWLRELTHANIPREYWALSLEEIETDAAAKRLVATYIENMRNALDQGLGMVLLGPLGVGKTSLMCAVGKEALLRGVPAYYTTTQALLDSLKPGADEEHGAAARAKAARVVLLDELDKVYLKAGSDWARGRIEELLRGGIPHHTAFLIGTNLEEEGIAESFGASVASLVRGHLKMVNLSGADRRDGMQRDWLARLKTGGSLARLARNKVIAADARRFQLWGKR